MKRLTYYSMKDSENDGWYLKSGVSKQDAVDRLAAYENSKLEPEEIKSLQAEWSVNLKSLEFYRQAQIDEADNAEWISVKDRMPDNEQFVLIIASGKPRENITLENAVVLAEYGSEGWILGMWPEWSDPNVTYWMPLPEPPKEE